MGDAHLQAHAAQEFLHGQVIGRQWTGRPAASMPHLVGRCGACTEAVRQRGGKRRAPYPERPSTAVTPGSRLAGLLASLPRPGRRLLLAAVTGQPTRRRARLERRVQRMIEARG